MPERILKQFELDSEHNREMDKTALKADINFDKRSQWMAFFAMMSGVFGTLCLAYLGKDVAAVVTAIGTAATMFKGVFSKKNPPKNESNQ